MPLAAGTATSEVFADEPADSVGVMPVVVGVLAPDTGALGSGVEGVELLV